MSTRLSLTDARKALDLSIDDCATLLRATQEEVSAWEQGAPMPASAVRRLHRLVREKQCQVQMEAAVGVCHDLKALTPTELTPLREFVRATLEAQRHTRNCPTCQAQDRYVEQHFPDLDHPIKRRVSGAAIAIAGPVVVAPRLLTYPPVLAFAFVLLRLLLLPLGVRADVGPYGLPGALLLAGSTGAMVGLSYALCRRLFQLVPKGPILCGAFLGLVGHGTATLLSRVLQRPILTDAFDYWFSLILVMFFAGAAVGGALDDAWRPSPKP